MRQNTHRAFARVPLDFQSALRFGARFMQLGLLGALLAMPAWTGRSQGKPSEEPSLEVLEEQARNAIQRRSFWSQDVAQAEAWLKANPGVVTNRTADGATLLHTAALLGDLSKATLLLAHGADVEATNGLRACLKKDENSFNDNLYLVRPSAISCGCEMIYRIQLT